VLLQQVYHRGTALWIGTTGDVTARFVEKDVSPSRRHFHTPAVHPDVVGVGIRLRAERRHRDSVDGHPPLPDQRLGRAP
jgi:hypothetical protein